MPEKGEEAAEAEIFIRILNRLCAYIEAKWTEAETEKKLQEVSPCLHVPWFLSYAQQPTSSVK